MDRAQHLTPVLGRYFEREWSRGEGHRLYDASGKAYLDFANGIAVTALGHGHPKVNAAIHAQVDRLVGPISAIGFTEPVSRLAAELAATFPDPLDSVFFLNSGSEAIEAALKLARRVTGRPGIIAFRGAFHGRTLGATTAWATTRCSPASTSRRFQWPIRSSAATKRPRPARRSTLFSGCSKP
jgi:4-aminobutyrate aminotransferase